MFLLMRLIAICLLALIGPAQSSLAQSSNLSPHEVVPKLLLQTRIDDIAEGPERIVVGASRLDPDGRMLRGCSSSATEARPSAHILLYRTTR